MFLRELDWSLSLFFSELDVICQQFHIVSKEELIDELVEAAHDKVAACRTVVTCVLNDRFLSDRQIFLRKLMTGQIASRSYKQNSFKNNLNCAIHYSHKIVQCYITSFDGTTGVLLIGYSSIMFKINLLHYYMSDRILIVF